MTTTVHSSAPTTPRAPASPTAPTVQRSQPVRRLRPARAARLRAGDLYAVIGFIVLMTLGLWWQHGGFAQLISGGTDTLLGLGQVSGLLAALGALGAIILTARPALLERRFGLDELLAAHRWFGIFTVIAIVVHAVSDTWAWAASSGGSFISALIDMATHESWMVAALVSTMLFLIVGLSSWHRIKNALAYETWYFLHLTGYLAVLLGFGHQLTLGTDIARDRLAFIWWCSLAVLTVAIVLWSRLGVVVRSLSRRLYVIAVSREANGIGSLHIAGPGLAGMRVSGGQFFIVRPLARGLWWQAHPFSVSAAPTTAGLRFTIKELGDDTPALLRIKSGTRVLLEGPYGVFTADRAAGHGVVLVAGGVGIAPIRAILEDCHPEQNPIVIVRVHAEHDLAHRSELEDLVHSRNGQLHVIVGPRQWFAANDPFTGASLGSLVPDIAGRHAFICGPASLESAVIKGLRKAGMPSSAIHRERFGV